MSLYIRQKMVLSHLHPVGGLVLASRETKRMRRWLAWCRANKRNVKFITLTYDLRPYQDKIRPDQLPEFMYDMSKQDRHVIRMFERLEQYTGEKLTGRWRAKMEFHRSGILHYHILVRDMPFVHQRDLTDLWGHGRVDIRMARIKHAEYMAKYQTKEGSYPEFLYDKPRRSVKVWGTSRGFFSVLEDSEGGQSGKLSEGQREEIRSDIQSSESVKQDDYDRKMTIREMLEESQNKVIVKDEAGVRTEYLGNENDFACALWLSGYKRQDRRFGWSNYDITPYQLNRVYELVVEMRNMSRALDSEKLNELVYTDQAVIDYYEKEAHARSTSGPSEEEGVSPFSCIRLQVFPDTQEGLTNSELDGMKDSELYERQFVCGIPRDEWPDEYAPF
ncbi:hypothetical protein JD969_15095 [Planctomycetota bacterium]|nr:hypothetical protein JD969_15095 [Planctomycetota bacterium]